MAYDIVKEVFSTVRRPDPPDEALAAIEAAKEDCRVEKTHRDIATIVKELKDAGEKLWEYRKEQYDFEHAEK